MFAGRKLLVADDSPYYRTVIGLTFTDEGMEVTTAGDGREALEKLEQSTPDVILAHVAMPGISGYELCDLVKQSERFSHIPVMLLVGLHEPFDQAEARRVGADDIVAKPFKSIRQLVSRVGSLLGGPAADASVHEYSTLGLERAEAAQPAAPENQTMTDTNVKVFIEAPSMTEPEPVEPAAEVSGSTCVADEELQTADTRKLERIDVEPTVARVEPISYAQDDTIEMEPAIQTDQKLDSARAIKDAPEIKEAHADNLPEDFAAHQQRLREAIEKSAESLRQALANQQTPYAQLNQEGSGKIEPKAGSLSAVDVVPDEHISTTGAPEMNEKPSPQPEPLQNQAVFSDALLDLGDFDSRPQVLVAEDLILDLEYEEPESSSAATVAEMVPDAISVGDVALPVEAIAVESDVAPQRTHEEQHAGELQEWEFATEAPAEAPLPLSVPEDQASVDPKLALSPETIEAIARRAVELMSDQVVREIAWEVVPELAELLIKKKLEEQK